MRHIGDITKQNGMKIPPVDIITGGSPCQDLSVAGKRAGLAGERSGLFMEQIRIIREMREATNGKQPRFMVWENVPGAFSSNNGEDFRAVLEETAKICDKDTIIPRPEKGKWTPAGCIMADGWSIAWRVHDAQFWGVPQRRKRISLVADFAGGSAPEILFEREGMSGDTEESGKEREGAAADVERSTGETSYYEWHSQDLRVNEIKDNVSPTLSSAMGMGGASMTTPMLIKQETSALAFESGAASRLGGHCYDNMCGTLRADMGDNQLAVCYGISSYESNAMKSANPHSGIYKADTTRTLDNNGGNPACNQGGMIVLEGNGSRPSHKGDGYAESDVSYTLNATEHHAVCYRGDAITSPVNASNPQPGDPCHTLTDDSRNYVVIENHPANSRVKVSEDGMVQTLSSRMGTGGGNVPLVAEPYTSSKNSYHQHFTNNGKAETLVATDYKDPPTVCEGPEYIVRRLTPLECERLQGFPDYWTQLSPKESFTDYEVRFWNCVLAGKAKREGKEYKEKTEKQLVTWYNKMIAADSNRYKALGNSLSLPFWQWMAYRMVKYLPQNCTMASLFSGIGGFELVFSRAGCKPLWASEVESFCIAVTKKRFPNNE